MLFSILITQRYGHPWSSPQKHTTGAISTTAPHTVSKIFRMLPFTNTVESLWAPDADPPDNPPGVSCPTLLADVVEDEDEVLEAMEDE